MVPLWPQIHRRQSQSFIVSEFKSRPGRLTIMRQMFKYVASTIPVIILFTGCCTGRHATQWEYKVAEPQGEHNNTRQALEPFLNDMAKEGWIFIERDSTGWCYFKRPKQ